VGAEALGWIGNGCFFSRFFVQWLSSERAKTSVVPTSFWWFSVAGAVLLGWAALDQDEPLLLVGYAVNGAIAVRNLVLARRTTHKAPDGRVTLLALALLIAVLAIELRGLSAKEAPLWLAIGALGQLLWTVRFPLQWWCSEREGVSHFPAIFWWMSLVGNFFMLAYTLHLGKPVFWLGYVFNPIVQVRNLMLGRQAARAA